MKHLWSARQAVRYGATTLAEAAKLAELREEDLRPAWDILEAEKAGNTNPRFLAYCIAEGHGPDEMIRVDTERYPGGKMCGFISWMRDRWNEWCEETGHPRAKDSNAPLWPRDHEAFDAWLRERYSAGNVQ